MGYTIILAIIMIFIISNLSSRISKLEKKLEGKVIRQVTHAEANPIPQPSATLNEAQLSQNLNSTSTIPETIYAKPIIETKEVSGEETGGKLLGKLGIGAVFFGVAFFIKYAFDNNWVGPTGRIAIGLIIGVLLFTLGQYLKNKYENFSEILMGGGMAIMYFSIYAAHAFYSLIDPMSSAIALFAISAIVFAVGTIRKDATLVTIATIGAFITPFLTGSTNNNMYEIFGYVTLTNLVILGISSYKKWPSLTVIALIGTITNIAVWGMQYYNESFLVPLMVMFSVSFLIFVLSSIYKTISEKLISSEFEYFVISACSAIYTLLIFILLYTNHEIGLSIILLALSAIFSVLSYINHTTNSADVTLGVYFRGLSIIFITLAIIVHFANLILVALLLALSVVLYLFATREHTRDLQIYGVIVYFIALFTYFAFNATKAKAGVFTAIANPDFAIVIFAVIAAYVIAWLYSKHGSVNDEAKNEGTAIFVVTANILTIYALSTQIYYSFPAHSSIANTYISILWAIYAAILTAIGFAKRISFLRKIGLGLFVITAIKVVADVWSLGQIYRIVSFVVFGVIALIASFAYAKYRDRL